MKTKQEQIEEMAVIGCVRNPQAHTAEECAKCDFKQGQCNAYRHAEALYEAGYRKIDEFEKCRKCPAWSGTDCVRNPYTKSCLDDKVNLKNEIKRLEKENKQLKTECALLDDELRIARQDTIDVLNKVKDYVNQLACDEYGDSACDTNYITIDIDKYEQDIDEMIEELTKCQK